MEEREVLPTPLTGGLANQSPVPSVDSAGYLAAPKRRIADTLRKLWRRKWLICGITFLVLSLTALTLSQLTPRYTAEATLRIGPTPAGATQGGSVPAARTPDEATMESEVYMLRSRQLVGRVVQRLALDRLPEFNPALREPSLLDRLDPQRLFRHPPADRIGRQRSTATRPGMPADSRFRNAQTRESVVNALLSALDVEQMGQSHMIAVRAQSEDPELAARIANALTSAYIEEKTQERNQETGKANRTGDARPGARVISAAAVPASPAFPPVNLFLALALLGGIVSAVLIALLLEYLDDTFRTDDDIEQRTALPVLSIIPKIRRRQLMHEYLMQSPTSEYSESLRKLEMSLLQNDVEGRAEVVLMASAVPDEGKSGICLSLARIAASADAKVVVVDCDWRRPQLHSILKQNNRAGLGDLLAGRVGPEDVVYRDASGAHMIFAGRLRTRDARLLYSERMRQLLQSLTRHYDLVLIDTPPVLVGAEVLYLSQLVDKAVYVVRWGHTRRDVALRGLRDLVVRRVPVAGIVLSQVDTRRYRRYVGRSSYYGDRSSMTGAAA